MSDASNGSVRREIPPQTSQSGPHGAGAGLLADPDGTSFFGMSFGFGPNLAMSALLARNWWVVALRGMVAILYGIAAVVLPGVTIAALVLLFAAYMVVDGVFSIAAAVRAGRRHEQWGLLVFEGIVDLIAAALAFFAPLLTILAFVSLMGAWAILSGVLMLGAAFRLHLAYGRWLLAFGGFVSIIWGFLLLIWPLAGALVLAWWMGAYALVFGVTLLVLAFRLRRWRHGWPPPDGLAQGA